MERTEMENLFEAEMRRQAIVTTKRSLESKGFGATLRHFNMRLKCSGVSKIFNKVEFDYLVRASSLYHFDVNDVDFLSTMSGTKTEVEKGYKDASLLRLADPEMNEIREVLLDSGYTNYYGFGVYLYYVTHLGK